MARKRGVSSKPKPSVPQPASGKGNWDEEDRITGKREYNFPEKVASAMEKGWHAHEFFDAQVIAGEGEDERTISVNAGILAMRSEFFREAFFGPSAQTSEMVVRLPLVASAVANKLLKFLYCGSLTLGGNIDETIALIVAANALGIPEAAQLASDDVVGRLNPTTAINYLRFAYDKGLTELQEACLGQVLSNANPKVLDEVLTLSDAAIFQIIAHDQLNLDEEDVFHFMLDYCFKKLGPQFKEHNPKRWDTKQQILIAETIKPMLPFLRVSLLSAEFISEYLEPSQLFSPKEICAMYRNFVVSPKLRVSLGKSNKRGDKSCAVGAFCSEELLTQIFVELGHRYRLTLLFQASRDGDDQFKFHELCDNRGPTLTFIRVGDNIGAAYAGQSWSSTGEFKSDSTCRLFALNPPNGQGFTVLKPQPHAVRQAMYCDPCVGPAFGEGYDLMIHNLDGESITQMPISYNGKNADPELMFGSVMFFPDDWAVYKVGGEKPMGDVRYNYYEAGGEIDNDEVGGLFGTFSDDEEEDDS